jgi:hypothetical protein
MIVMEIYGGSDGEATKALYARLERQGPAGVVAMNLFRAQKASARAKVYRGGVRGVGSFKAMAYEKKNWSLGNLCGVLAEHGDRLQLRWGWQADPATPGFEWVLYVDTPCGQVSFHSAARLKGPDYPYAWDGIVNASVGRIIRWCEQLLAGAEVRV